ncbi:MAG: 2-keto-4-pentenoate hydratase [Alphaproteobacteria bacterium]
MDETALGQAVACLLEARQTGRKIAALPEGCHPHNALDAHGIQDRTIDALGETVAGWKVGAPSGGVVVRGAILQSRLFTSPAVVPAALTPLLGVEPEIAFRFDQALPAREYAYDRDEIAAAVTAFLAIEIVDSRFAGYPDLPDQDKNADFVSNGGLVVGPDVPNWQSVDLVNLSVKVTVGDEVVADVVGGHPRTDPLIPAIELANQFRTEGGVAAGKVMTTGSYCGLKPGRADVPITAAFADLGKVELRFQS